LFLKFLRVNNSSSRVMGSTLTLFSANVVVTSSLLVHIVRIGIEV
jgi:hypothetical protein